LKKPLIQDLEKTNKSELLKRPVRAKLLKKPIDPFPAKPADPNV